MRQLWVGIGLLLFFLILGIVITVTINDFQSALASDLYRAGQAAEAGDWDLAQALSDDVKARWQKGWHAVAAIVDHAPMEEIDCLFSQLEVYLQNREAISFSACCASLETMTRALGEGQTVNWWNLL